VAPNGAICFRWLTFSDSNCLCPPNPQGPNPKPKTKKDGLERARALLTVQAALQRRALAVEAILFFLGSRLVHLPLPLLLYRHHSIYLHLIFRIKFSYPLSAPMSRLAKLRCQLLLSVMKPCRSRVVRNKCTVQLR
jgi:hypothetical protein